MKRFYFACVCFFVLAMGLMINPNVTSAKTYKVSPKSKPCNGYNRSTYNKHTKNYYTIQSYLDKIASQKGGTLVLKKGTYRLSNTLYVSKNTKIILSNGVVLRKETKTGVKGMPASTTMFQFVNKFKAIVKGAYGKHNGEKNISLIGKGKAVIDMNYAKKGNSAEIGVVMGHNKNVKIDNITFKNMRLGHMIEMDACKNVKITNCTFCGFKPSGYYNKEAINLDTPDKKRDGFNSKWSKKDCTPNDTVLIQNCRFDTLEAGIGTHQYTGNRYHKNVKITKCSFNRVQTAVRVLNWKKANITYNTFTNCSPNWRYPYSFFIAGAKGLNFSYNQFSNCAKDDFVVQFWLERGYNANQYIYSATTCDLTDSELELMDTNDYDENCGEICEY